MKTSFILVIFLFFGCPAVSQEINTKTTNTKNLNQKPVIEKQITWETDFNIALSKAKMSNKILFVECFSPNCPVCQSLEPLFKNSVVAKKYNSNFVNFKLNIEKQEAVKHLNERNILPPSWPMFLFFDGNGKLHLSDVTPDIKVLNDIADMALDPNKRAENYSKRYEDGDRSLDFLINLSTYKIVNMDTSAAISVGEELFKNYPKESLGSETSWKITKKCILDVHNGFATYWFNNLLKAKEYELKNGHSGGEFKVFTKIIQASLIGSRASLNNTNQLNEIRKYMKLIGAGQYEYYYLWELETKAHIREGNPLKALAVGNNIISKFEKNGATKVYITKVFIDNFPNDAFLNDARKWLSNSLQSIDQDNQRTEYYYESARLYKKVGNQEKAKREAKMALEFASKGGYTKPKV